jgi:hypothetical protein
MTNPITVLAHKFTVGDVEDPDIYAAQPIYEWQQSEAGQWMMKHSDPTPSWHQSEWPLYGTNYQIRGYLTPQLYTFWKLKYE